LDIKQELSRGANRKEVEKPSIAKARKNPTTGRNEKPKIKSINPKLTRNIPKTKFKVLTA
jgi:hypothetical protein